MRNCWYWCPEKGINGTLSNGGCQWNSVEWECIDLTKNSVKILGIHSSYNKKIENEKNFMKAIVNLFSYEKSDFIPA